MGTLNISQHSFEMRFSSSLLKINKKLQLITSSLVTVDGHPLKILQRISCSLYEVYFRGAKVSNFHVTLNTLSSLVAV